ncbi:FtsX-like permease family protein [Pseudoflavitalea sp. X16]|uniref:ABC transporter permease n=1 Tax=Paraflavitalea devenefica TaxID=2716334 RepID=UPI00141DD455|nr:ABC transporter permease [Paraflavitalea devenefica]NII28040.1 FtsX-like permease family protein [Paraflavitalea devenefica]
MLKNYFTIAFRNLVKNKVHSLINIAGLAAGMSVALLIGLWIWDELSFNKYHRNYDRIARVMKHMMEDGTINSNYYLPYPLAMELKTTWRQEFKQVVTARPPEEVNLSGGETQLAAKGQFIDAGAPGMLTLNMLKGNYHGLQEPHSVLLAASTAKALFGKADPMGKAIKLNNSTSVKVTGVYEDLPLNTHFQEAKFFAPFDLYMIMNPWVKEQSWDNQFLFVYAEINPGADFEKVSDHIKDAEINITKNLDNYKEQAARKPQVFLYPMSKWHLYASFKEGIIEGGAIQFVWLVGIIGGFVLLLACINFMNLSTARSEKRAKEVGIRKAVGSVRRQLIIQFFTESLLTTILAFLVALFIVTISLPWFNELAAKEMTMLWSNPGFWLCCSAFILLTGLLAGSYPALYLSSFKPVKVLKGTFRAGRFAAIPRKALVVMQFTVSVTLIICTMVVYKQILFAKDRPVGYNREGLLMVWKKSADFRGKSVLLRNELKKTGTIAELAESGGRVTSIWQSNGGFDWKGRPPSFDPSFGTLAVSQEYGKTVGWQFVAGRDFSGELAGDSAAIVLNESAVKLMGLKDPVGEVVRWETAWRKARYYKIIGVIKDMVMESPFEPVLPTVFRMEKELRWINIKLDPQVAAGKALSAIEATFKKIIPGVPFDYKFADVEYAAKFAAEERIGKLAAFFATLAIFISCLGLFGLASFTAEQRTKEIGVRKVLGASAFNVWRLLSKDFVVLVMIALGIAIPAAHYFMHNWLENYQYRSNLPWWLFAVTGIGAILITLLTVSFHAVKAAFMNPVKSLRTE